MSREVFSAAEIEEHIRKIYREHAREWMESMGEEPPKWADELQEFLSLLSPKNCIVLEIGSGTGKEGEILKRSGVNYTGGDLSVEMLEQAQLHREKLQLVQSNAYELPFADSFFDGLWTSETLIHYSKSKMAKVLQSIWRVTKSGAIIFISMKKGEGEGFIKEEMPSKAEITPFFNYYRPDEFEAILVENRFKVIRTVDKDEQWMGFFVRTVK